MIPILYKQNEIQFITNGIGKLTDAISCLVTEEKNGIYELQMQYPIEGKRYNDLATSQVILAKPNDKSQAQPFRIYKISTPIKGSVTIYAEHISYWLNSIPVSPFEASNPSSALINLSNSAMTECPFIFWTDNDTQGKFEVTKPISARAAIGGTDSIISTYGGELEFDRYTVKLHASRGSDAGVTIRYGKNLIDLTQEQHITNTITGIMPYYQNDNTLVILPEKVVMCDRWENYPYRRIAIVDFSGEFEQVPSEAELRTKANEYMEAVAVGTPTVSITVKFESLWQTEEYNDIAMLESVALCDYVTVLYEKLNINVKAQVVKTVYDSIKERYSSIEIGELKGNLSQDLQAVQKEVAAVPTVSQLQESVQRATALITGNSGGNVITRFNENGEPYEMLIMDTDNIDTAKQVWRWNLSGLGYSANGVEGPYGLAMTIDGEIVADFITAGTFDGSLVKANTIAGEALSIQYRESVSKEIRDGDTKLFKELETQLSVLSDSILARVSSIEGAVTSSVKMYDTMEEPTLSNYPANEWYEKIYPSEELYPSHELVWQYTDDSYNSNLRSIVYDHVGDKCYRFIRDTQGNYAYEIVDNETVNYMLNRFAEVEISVDGVRSEVGRVETEMKGNYSTTTVTKSLIEQSASEISLQVSEETIRAKGAESSLSSRITVNANGISSKVSKGEVSSSISQEADKVSIKSNRMEIETDDFTLTNTGIIDARAGFLGGWSITSNMLYGSANNRYVGLSSPVNSENVSRMFIDDTSVSPNRTLFFIHNDGSVYMGSDTILTCNGEIDCAGTVEASVLKSTGSLQVSGAATITGNLICSGTTKNRAIETEYGVILMNAYETASPMFGDIGTGMIDETGTCDIYLDELFLACMDQCCKYVVFLQSYSATNVYVSGISNIHFTVRGEPGTEFAWEIKGKQRGTNDYRLETMETNNYSDAYIKENAADTAANEYDLGSMHEESYEVFRTSESDTKYDIFREVMLDYSSAFDSTEAATAIEAKKYF